MFQFDMSNPDEGWRKADPGDMAAIDQLEARYKDILRRLLTAQDLVHDAAGRGDTQAMLAAGVVFNEAMMLLEPDDTTRFISFMTMSMLSMTNMLTNAHKAILHGINELTDGLPEGQRSAILEGLWADSTEKEKFTTGCGQELVAVHTATQCASTWCVVHNPAPGPWIQWPTWWPPANWGPRMFYRRCPHGVAHPAVEDMLLHDWDHRHEDCDGCPCFHLDCDEITDPNTGAVIGWMERK